MRRILWMLAIWGLASATPALAWGELGHKTVAQIALANVKPATAAKIRALMRAEKGLGTPQCRVRNLADASYWPDCLRGDPDRWRYTFGWHYQDHDVCGNFDIKANCANGNCVTAQITRDAKILANTQLPTAQRLEALAFLAHFVGDVHMPLHAAEHDNDHGGNGVSLANVPSTDPKYPQTSLHWFWDTNMAEKALAGPSVVRSYSGAERSKWATGDVADWARESYDMAKNVVYPMALGNLTCGGASAKSATVSDAAVNAALPATRLRIVQAGLRLAKLLDQSLG
ncbi:MAG: hypothetical protein RLY97_1517 [Pseudomonadota bacterium]|jgi:S1/P1 Nuclease